MENKERYHNATSKIICASAENRTLDPIIKSYLLYH